MNKWIWGFALSFALLNSCQQLDFANEKESKNEHLPNGQIIIPVRTGMGTQESPYTAFDISEGSDTLIGKSVWVIAYAVGETYKSLNNANFVPPFLYNTSLLLAGDSLCQDKTKVIPAELSSSSLKSELALSNVPHCHRQCLLLQGTVQNYYNVTGIRSIKHYYWLPKDYIIPTNRPEEWTIVTIK